MKTFDEIKAECLELQRGASNMLNEASMLTIKAKTIDRKCEQLIKDLSQDEQDAIKNACATQDMEIVKADRDVGAKIIQNYVDAGGKVTDLYGF